MVIEIVDIPIKNGDFQLFFVCLPGRVTQKYPGIIPRVSVSPNFAALQFLQIFRLEIHPFMALCSAEYCSILQYTYMKIRTYTHIHTCVYN